MPWNSNSWATRYFWLLCLCWPIYLFPSRIFSVALAMVDFFWKWLPLLLLLFLFLLFVVVVVVVVDVVKKNPNENIQAQDNDGHNIRHGPSTCCHHVCIELGLCPACDWILSISQKLIKCTMPSIICPIKQQQSMAHTLVRGRRHRS